MCTENADILASRQRMEVCSTCEFQASSESPFVNNSMEDFHFKNVQQSLKPENTRVCGTCLKKTLEIDDRFHEIAVISCEDLDKQNDLTLINDIKNEIDLKGEKYELFAAIQYDPQLKHFIPHIKRKSNNWETYDDLNRTKTNTYLDEEMLIFMLFYGRKSNGMYAVVLMHVLLFP